LDWDGVDENLWRNRVEEPVPAALQPVHDELINRCRGHG